MNEPRIPIYSTLILLLLAPAAVASTDSVPFSPWRNCQTVDNDWLYLEDPRSNPPAEEDAGFVPVELPHTWNADDTLNRKDYRQDASWYRKLLNFSPGDLRDRHFLRFGAAGQHARVFVNGDLIGEHRGGYSAFTVEITDQLKAGDNRVDVWVSNAEDRDLGPYNADFNFYGGLYRSVQLIRAPRVCLSRDTRGGPGVRVWSEKLSETSADLKVTTTVDNSRGKKQWLVVRAELIDAKGRVVSYGQHAEEFEPSTAPVTVNMSEVANPALWSPEDPQLYRLRVRLFRDGNSLDEVNVNHGFRWCQFTADGQFLLNGQPYDLHGVNRHQDLEGYGNAVPPWHHERDIKLIKEVGANWLRLAHYQQDDYVLDLCDRLGLLVWEEIPFVNVLTDTDAFRDNYETMLREMIEQHHNHPSIIMWGVQNENLLRQEGELHEEKIALTKHLAAVVREEDPRRVVVQAGHGIWLYGELGMPAITDVMGYNVYYGWYGGEPEDLVENMEQLRQFQPDRPHVIAEYGAGSDVRIHREEPASQDFSEEWQVHYLESYLDQFADMKICGSLWWNMFDFGSAKRGDSIPHVNQKGIIGFDHETKKDVWYLMKSRWSDEPVLYLVSPRFTSRTGQPTKSYHVLTNFDEVELFHQGKSLGTQQQGFRWDVTLQPGQNQLLARGSKGRYQDQHGFVVKYTKEKVHPKPTLQNYTPLVADWQLTWSDEFDVPGLPNRDQWRQEEGFIRNDELQYYTDRRANNARVEDGYLIVEAHKQHMSNPHFDSNAGSWRKRREFAQYTSASLTTKGTKEILYGRLDVRAKLPAGRGVWPAIWLLGVDYDTLDWPRCGELDIMEHVGYMPDTVWSAVHTEKYNWTKATQKKLFRNLPNPQDEFHTYSVHWYADRLECFVDGKCHFVFEKEPNAGADAWPYDRPFYLIINLAIGGGLGGRQGVDESIFPQKFVVDYVRLYKQIGK